MTTVPTYLHPTRWQGIVMAKAQEVVAQEPLIDELTTSFDDAVSMFQSAGMLDEVVSADITEKDELCGVPLLITQWKTGKDETYGTPWVVVLGITKDNKSFVITDGSQGIAKQLFAMEASTGRRSGILCKNGLNRSDYTYKDGKGNEIPASTYYLS